MAVWLNKEDASKNGIYYLYDSSITSTFKAPDVTKEEHWHKLVNLEDISGLTTLIDANTDKLAGIETTVVDLINERLTKLDLSDYAKIADVDSSISAINSELANKANSDEVASLITKVNQNTNNISAINDKVAAMLQPKESSEISMAADGTLGIKELNVNKLTQTPGETLVLSGGNASI